MIRLDAGWWDGVKSEIVEVVRPGEGRCLVLTPHAFPGEDWSGLDVAHAWAAAGSDVLLTEAEPLGIASYPLRRKGRRRLGSNVTDWLTVFPAKGSA